MALNGWNSFDSLEKPESGEQVLTLSYAGEFPAPPDPFSNPDSRVFCVCKYFYPGDRDIEEALGGEIRDAVFDEEGFYTYDCDLSASGLMRWRRLIDGSVSGRGILFWKRLDWPDDNR